jgi:non-specific serine/threonine protein kinase
MLLKTCPKLHVLATSRQRLNLAGETAWRVPSLPVPEPGTDPSALADVDSVRLFLERAIALTPPWS